MKSSAEPKTSFPSEPLAIVGMACRLPGADDLEAYWQLMAKGGSGITEMPPDRMDRRLYLSPEKDQKSKSYSSISGLIPARADDPSLDCRTIDLDQLQWDPCHEILCGVVDEARANAGWCAERLSESRTGVYVGHSCGSAIGGDQVLGSMIPDVAETLGDMPEFQDLSETERFEILSDLVARIQKQRPIRKSNSPRLEANYAAQLVARRYHLDGPQMVVDAACASSMIALALAAAALTEGKIDQAIVSSASNSKTDSLILFSQAQSCSAVSSRPFDASADGLVSSEGYVVLVVKTLARARFDGDNIQGVIRGIGISSDGRGRSLWAPRKEGQLEAIRRAYSGLVTKDTVQYVEAHATSTQVGDATELEALAAYFGDRSDKTKIPLGSVKSNIGHTLESAGLAGLVKVVLCMQKGFIPPTINLSTPNTAVDWANHPLAPVKSLIPWPDIEDQPRRAGVNSFGIGGLNAHVVLDGPLNAATEPSRRPIAIKVRDDIHRMTSRFTDENHSIAIIGRGVIVPGAFNVASFGSLLESGASQLVSPPSNRWRDTPYSGSRPAIRQMYPRAKGGYVLDYHYDWRKHRVPPLQIENANPLQFMLLDATQQALDESGYSDRPFDRSRAAVIVGTLFGGDFAHELQVGLRMPEILDELTQSLRSRKWNPADIQSLCAAAEAQIVKAYPAISDQTGSFTCSTQASRVAKTLNVMGGAMSIDGGDCSSFAALQSAQSLLTSGAADFVFCAAAQRDLDAVAFEAWNYRTFDSIDGLTNHMGLVPGEGVVVLLLRRLADAKADENIIHGIIRDVRATKRAEAGSKSIEHRRRHPSENAESSIATLSPRSSALTRQFGHLQGASGLLEVLGLTMANPKSFAPTKTIVRTTTESCEFDAVIETPGRQQKSVAKPANRDATTDAVSNAEEILLHVKSRKVSDSLGSPVEAINVTAQTSVRSNGAQPLKEMPKPRTYRVWGVDEIEVRQRLLELISSPGQTESDSVRACIPKRAPFRLTFVASGDDLQQKSQIALDVLDRKKSAARAPERGVYYCELRTAATPRIAGLFPGQGSQNNGMLSDVFKTSEGASSYLERANRALSRIGESPCSSRILQNQSIGKDELRSIQLSMLTADVCAFQVAKEWGIRPDFVLGHSFGEYAALVAAGALDFDAAIAITLARAKAVADCTHCDGAMLSIAATLNDVEPLMEGRSNLYISHANSPRQTVVAGVVKSVMELAAKLKSLGIAAVQVPVGSPFHTPLLEAAQPALKVALEQYRWRTPRLPLLSSVSGRFAIERDEIVANLARQLSQPLNWIEVVERLIAEDVQLFVEMGPGRVLTGLTQQIIGERNVFVIPMDDPSIDPMERKLRIQAAMEAVGIPSELTASAAPIDIFSSRPSVVIPQMTKREAIDPAFDQVQRQPTTSVEVSSSDELVGPTVSTDTQPDRSFDRSLSQFLIEMIVEQTGYPPEVIDLDGDFEADLGIDSIRKAQILGELREYFDLTAGDKQATFNELRSPRDVINLLQKSPGKMEWLRSTEDMASPSSTIVSGDVAGTSPTVPLDDESKTVVSFRFEETSIHTGSRIDEFLIDFVIERTGYPRDVIELDADLESDLGIDSIVKAQLIGEVRDHFQFPMEELSKRAVLSEIRTLRHICDMIDLATKVAPSGVFPSNSVAGASANCVEESKDDLVESCGSDDCRGDDFASEDRPTDFAEPISPGHADLDQAFDRGKAWGRNHRHDLQNQLFDLADSVGSVGTIETTESGSSDWNDLAQAELAELRGIAAGANVHPHNVFSLRRHRKLGLIPAEVPSEVQDDVVSPHAVSGIETPAFEEDGADLPLRLTRRFQLAMSPAETRKWSGQTPDFAGGAIIIGDHSECHELAHRLESFGVTVSWLRELGSREEAVSSIEKIWKATPSPHLFVLSARDATAVPTLDESSWKRRREVGITSLYWFCQKWLQLVEQAGLLDDSSLIGVTALGGDFGVANRIESAESGALTGLFKAIIIENWVNGCRTMPIKLLDFARTSPAKAIVDAICVELTDRSYDFEIGWKGESRSVLRSVPAPIESCRASKIIPRGHWVVTGGARGITAYVVSKLVDRFPNVHFHLVGTAPKPTLTDAQRWLAETDLAKLRADVMRAAKAEKQSPVKVWQAFEKEIEIDRTMRELNASSSRATFYSCDVANRSQLSELLNTIRRQSGPITGIIHGAGVGKDASFQRKDPVMVERCLSAKVDGVLNLMALTQDDPLQAFIGFGSISGRFGANGHTDYSLANDMLAKMVGWHRHLRPTVPSAAFHWHAWDDIGMATKPETRLALEMIGMTLMPADEGVEHFLREISAGLPMAEVVITDTRYFRLFYPADRMVVPTHSREGNSKAELKWPLIHQTRSSGHDVIVSEAVLDPVVDPFLVEHRINDRPLLPMVIMTELLAEGASAAHGGRRPTRIRDFEILTSLKFPNDVACEVKVSSLSLDKMQFSTELRADFHSRNGKLISASRLYAKATIDFDSLDSEQFKSDEPDREELRKFKWQPTKYLPAGSDFYLGGPLQCLRKYALDLENHQIWGRICAPSLSELAGFRREVTNWITPSAMIDATLFTSGLLAWNGIRPGVTLPRGAEQILFYNTPRPAEMCWVRSRLVNSDQTQAVFDIMVWGNDHRPLFAIHNYVAAWLPS